MANAKAGAAVYEDVMKRLRSMGNQKNAEGVKRFGIVGGEILGISLYDLRKMAKELGKDHARAARLWASGVHEGMMLAIFVEEPGKVTEEQMERWAKDFGSWDICDQACTDLFDQTPLAWKKAREWSERKEEFVKRGAFALIAGLAVHDRKAKDADFEALFPLIERQAWDDRNFVRKAANWALRNVGKRNISLNAKAVAAAEKIAKQDSKSARWIASDALRELRSEKLRERLRTKGGWKGA
jgi:3-methyladenine DNA glycosylase AlkD